MKRFNVGDKVFITSSNGLYGDNTHHIYSPIFADPMYKYINDSIEYIVIQESMIDGFYRTDDKNPCWNADLNYRFQDEHSTIKSNITENEINMIAIKESSIIGAYRAIADFAINKYIEEKDRKSVV